MNPFYADLRYESVRPSINPNDFKNSAAVSAPLMMVLCVMISVTEVGAKAYAQENSTAVLEEMRDQARDIAAIRNASDTQTEMLEQISASTTKLSTQGAYTTLSVFFLGIGLVIFGLRLTTKIAQGTGRYLILMVWALTVPVIALVAIYQYGAITNNQLKLFMLEEPYILLSFLMYIPIGIVLFLLITQKRITRQSEAAKADDLDRIGLAQAIERLTRLREKGLLTDGEFKTLKKLLLDNL